MAYEKELEDLIVQKPLIEFRVLNQIRKQLIRISHGLGRMADILFASLIIEASKSDDPQIKAFAQQHLKHGIWFNDFPESTMPYPKSSETQDGSTSNSGDPAMTSSGPRQGQADGVSHRSDDQED